jgi:hypothetical protein
MNRLIRTAVPSAGDVIGYSAAQGKGIRMQLTAILVATSLLVPISVDRDTTMMLDAGSAMPAEQKEAAIRPLVSSATDCIARTVSADPRFRVGSRGAELSSLIVESVPRCVDVLRRMIDSYDRLYGGGAGETFFMGPYLDGLPTAVGQRIKTTR